MLERESQLFVTGRAHDIEVAECKWYVGDLHLRVWGNECVAFNCTTLGTHIVGMPAGQLLLALRASPGVTTTELAEVLSGFADSLPAELLPEVEQVLQQFCSFGLVVTDRSG